MPATALPPAAWLVRVMHGALPFGESRLLARKREVNVVSAAKGGARVGLLGRNHSSGAHERP